MKMKQNHYSDDVGNPAGGVVNGIGFSISWQRGPLGRGKYRKEPNGAFVEDIIRSAIGRLEFYQSSKFNCAANGSAIEFLDKALIVLDERTKDREDREVKGTHEI